MKNQSKSRLVLYFLFTILAAFLVIGAGQLGLPEDEVIWENVSGESKGVCPELSIEECKQYYQCEVIKKRKQSPKCVDKKPRCKDSDDGQKYDTKGVVTTEKGEYPDSCNDGYLQETACTSDNKLKTYTYKCPNSCKDGACLPKKSRKVAHGVVPSPPPPT